MKVVHDIWSEALRERGLKSTPARMAILNILAGAKKPLTVEQIGKKIKQIRLDTVTLYRTVSRLTHVGMVRHIDFRHGHAHYELNDPKRDHHHIICTKCHAVEDFTGCDFSDITRRALSQTKNFRTIAEHSLELFGLCKKCEK